MLNINKIFIRRKNKFILNNCDNEIVNYNNKKNYIATVAQNLASVGYILSESALNKLEYLSFHALKKFNTEILKAINELVGSDKDFKPMYPNFPKQVLDASQAELFFNAIIHYLTLAKPVYEKAERLPLFENHKVQILDLGTFEEFNNIFTNIMLSNVPLSENDKHELELVLSSPACEDIIIPDKIPQKETFVLVAKTLYKNNNIKLNRMFKTVTDILRFAAVLSECDASLATNPVFKTFSRQERTLLLSLLNSCKQNTNLAIDDMFAKRGMWLRLGEKLHPGEKRYLKRFPRAFELFDIIRNDNTHITYNSKLESAFKTKNIEKVIQLLVTKPGVFVRRLNQVIQLIDVNNVIQVNNTIKAFNNIIDKVSTPVLLKTYFYLNDRTSNLKYRVFFIKKAGSNFNIIENTLSDVDAKIVNKFQKNIYNCLVKRFSKLDTLGKVYIDTKTLSNYAIPFSQRGTSKALKTIPRFSRFKIDNNDKNKYLRIFLWWKNTEDGSCVDIDTSMPMFSEDWKYVDHVSYTKLSSSITNSAHSGDIVNAPQGACEFIDLDIKSAKEAGVRYVMMTVWSYTQHRFSELPECFAGWMFRHKRLEGEVFEAKTVKQKIDLTSNSTSAIPLIFDLKTNEIIWLDLFLTTKAIFNNFESSRKILSRLGEALTEKTVASLTTLFSMHIDGRAKESVKEIQEADTIFTGNVDIAIENKKIITPFDIDVIISDFLQ